MKKALIFIVAICLFCCGITVTAAELDKTADSREAKISAEVPDSHTINVLAENAEAEFDGIKGTTFNVPRLNEFTISIKCNNGYKVKQILLNGEDVTNAFADGKITLSGIYEASSLNIITEKLPKENGNSSIGKGDLTSPQTGENINLFLCIILLLLSAGGIFLAGATNRKNKSEHHK